jgi:putative ABC transport system permease protein
MFIRMAARNLMRRPVQSLIAAAAIAAGLTATVWMTNFQDGSWITLLDDSMRAAAGHVVVQPDGYQDSKDSELLLENSSAIAESLKALEPDAVVLRRAFIQGLLASSTNTVGVAVNAVEPAEEKKVSKLPDRLVEGAWLEDKKQIVIGSSLAKKLGVGLKDKVVLTISSKGEIVGLPFRVAGIFTTGGTRVDSFFAIAPLSKIQQLLPHHADPATQVVLQLPSIEAPDDLTSRARASIGAGPEILTWREALPEAVKASELDKAFAMIIWAVLAIVVSVGVLNLLLMSIFQRTRELGVMLAVGMRPGEVTRLLLAEGAILGILGAVVGFAAGTLLTIPMANYGIDLAAMQSSAPVGNVAVDTVMKSRYVWGKDLIWVAWFVGLSIVASIWPAVRAGRLEPVDALRAV